MYIKYRNIKSSSILKLIKIKCLKFFKKKILFKLFFLFFSKKILINIFFYKKKKKKQNNLKFNESKLIITNV